MRVQSEAPDIDVTAALRQVGAAQESFVSFQSIRTLPGSAASAFSFGTHALRPTTALTGDLYEETDRHWLFYWSGTVWKYLAGVNYGTNATRAAISVTANDDGALFYTTDTKLWWQVSSGAWVQRDIAAVLIETGGPTTLTMGAIANGDYLTRSGTTIIGAAAVSAAALNVATATTTPYTVSDADDVILVDATAGLINVNLHSAATAKQKPYHVKLIDASGNGMKINSAADLVDGAAFQGSLVQYVSFTVIPDNAAATWWIA